ncbi:MAG: tRNA-dihydrouridine synthase [Patescibacteria group bacterium]
MMAEGWKESVTGSLVDESERPIVAQIFGGKPNFTKAAELSIAELGFDGIDINIGCPSKDIEKSLAGAGLIKHLHN